MITKSTRLAGLHRVVPAAPSSRALQGLPVPRRIPNPLCSLSVLLPPGSAPRGALHGASQERGGPDTRPGECRARCGIYRDQL